MSKSVSETLKEQGVVLTDAPNFEQPMETAEKTRVELAMEKTNTNISKKCRKAFKKFVKKYELEIDFERYEGKTDELMELINKTATDDEEVSLVRHMKSYCKSVLKNLSKLPKEEAITGINGKVITEKKVKEMSSDETEKHVQSEEKTTEVKKAETKSLVPKKKIMMPMMSDYIKVGKVHEYARDLKAYYVQHA